MQWGGRYDADCSGTLNSTAELQQLTINLTFNLGLRIKPDRLQVCDELELSSQPRGGVGWIQVYMMKR